MKLRNAVDGYSQYGTPKYSQKWDAGRSTQCPGVCVSSTGPDVSDGAVQLLSFFLSCRGNVPPCARRGTCLETCHNASTSSFAVRGEELSILPAADLLKADPSPIYTPTTYTPPLMDTRCRGLSWRDM